MGLKQKKPESSPAFLLILSQKPESPPAFLLILSQKPESSGFFAD